MRGVGRHDGNVTAATNKTHYPAQQRGFSGGETKKNKKWRKRREKREEYAKPYWKGEAELLDDRAYGYGCNSETPLRDAVGS